ncbi:PAN/Apple domain-containing protein [Massilia scottii]|uniref:PAN/Apple domain-containing protein n=1 Tax=Massilia scottii TaxID=3057166 RepID=UPI0027968957|nr:PAN/Apple domain-containing protein [Massilia sp. CCM 9029]MDQ1831615.1 PAN/Apple domain-containing protein [Massilia sp. CCM 9029]
MKTVSVWFKILIVALGLLWGSTALAVDYLSGIWKIPATGELGAKRYNTTRQACQEACTANQSCSGFYAFTDWDTCQLYGPDADVAARVGPWSNVQMNWKKASPDPLAAYTSGFLPIPNNGALTDTLYGYQPQQCAKMCNGKADCVGFHTITTSDVCRLYGLESTWSSTNGPWSNAKLFMKGTQPAILMVDIHVIDSTSGGNARWTKEYAQQVLAKATQEMNNGEVVFSLGTFDRIVDDQLFNGRALDPIFLKFDNTGRPGRINIYVAAPMSNYGGGVAWVTVTLSPYAVISSRYDSFNYYDVEDTARIFLHEIGHNQAFAHNGSFYSYPYATDWYWSSSPLARQVFARLAAWSKLRQKGFDPNLKNNNYSCAVNSPLPDRGTFPAPNVPAATSQECAARCSQSSSCVAFYSFTTYPSCVLFDATSIGNATQPGNSATEMCWKTAGKK